jgi:transglutaminase-like putative cysteine protease
LSAIAAVRIARANDIKAEFVGGIYSDRVLITKPVFGNADHIKESRRAINKEPHAWILHRKNYIDITSA